MELFQLILVLLLTGAALTVVAQRIGAPYPALLAVAGATLAFVPSGVDATLDPELALALFVAPTLMDAAFDASPRDLKANWLPVGSLVLVAVAVTVVAVAFVARWLVPGMPWAVAVVLGAIVAPPDAAAATAVLRSLSPPHRVMVILEGESLLNDASALLIYRVALGAVAGGAFSVWSAGWLLVLSCAGGAAVGFAAARLYMLVVRPAHDIAVSVVTQFVGTFSVWLLAVRLGVSPVITTVAYAATIARMVPIRLGAEHRRASYAVWEVAVFVLNALAFILIGLQLRGVLDRLDGHAALTAVFAAAVFLTVVGARMAWVLGFSSLLRRLAPADTFRPPFKGSLVVSWCGMRGIVTLATALALPAGQGGVPPFPYRDLVIAAAFAVVLGTLVIQGITLAPLMRLLDFGDDGAVQRELALAREEAAEAALDLLRATPGAPASALVAEHEAAGLQADRHSLTLQVIAAKRARLLELRRGFVIGDHTFHQLEEELDWAEGHTLRRLRSVG